MAQENDILYLSTREIEIMSVFWNAKEPLRASELARIVGINSIHAFSFKRIFGGESAPKGMRGTFLQVKKVPCLLIFHIVSDFSETL